jgi:hypothetical protein
MNKIIKLLILVLSIGIKSSFAMLIEKKESNKKPCCCMLCCPECCKCCCGFFGGCLDAADSYGGLVIKIAETIAIPFPEAQKILAVINQIYTIANPFLKPLADGCKNFSTKFTIDYINALLKQGIDIRPYINNDGSAKPELTTIVNEALTISQTVTRWNTLQIQVTILSSAELKKRFETKHMLFTVDSLDDAGFAPKNN